MRLAAPPSIARTALGCSLALALLATTAVPALAQPGSTPYVPPPASPEPAQPVPYAPAPGYTPAYTPGGAHPAPAPLKSETTATLLSLGTTALGIGALALSVEAENMALAYVGAAGLFIGPAAGHIYAGETKRALGSSLLRAGGAVVFAVGALTSSHCDSCGPGDDHDGRSPALWLGGAIFVGATLYDFWDAHKAARRYNEKHQPSYLVAPTMMSSERGSAPGFAVMGRF
jgi:hypothetical protein